MKISKVRQLIAPSLSLFFSASTLICCALPSLFVTIGMGAALISMVSIFPWIIVITQYKILIFTIAGFLLIISGFLFWYGRKNVCPSDKKEAELCTKLRKSNFVMIIISSIIYSIGFFFAFLASSLFQ